MADDQKLGPVPQAFDPGKLYRVQLSTAVVDGPTTYAPGASHAFNGAFAETIRDKILAAREEA